MEHNCLNEEFDDIRPYCDDEISDAMVRITESEFFPLLSNFVFPNRELSEVKEMVRSLNTAEDFQKRVMYHVNEQIISRTMNHFGVGGLDLLDKDKSYLFISNHRDIMLDASLLQNALVDYGCNTSQITFGANLMKGQTVIDIGKSNKMFRVEREGSIKDFYMSSLRLSKYIRKVITEKHESVWIAQRNGRTKNGDDHTDQGIIKMFGMSHSEDKVEALTSLNIVPICVSYEWEPCDVLKTLELYESQFSTYTKKPGEDLNSILTGIVEKKGNVHFEVCRPLTADELLGFSGMTNIEFNKAVALLIDSRIYEAYKFFPNNYIAYDMRYGCSKYLDKYTDEQKDCFIEYLKWLDNYSSCNISQLCDIFLGIYSNPIVNYKKCFTSKVE